MEIFNNILDSVREPLMVLDSDLKVVKANPYFYHTFNVKPDETEGILIYTIHQSEGMEAGHAVPRDWRPHCRRDRCIDRWATSFEIKMRP